MHRRPSDMHTVLTRLAPSSWREALDVAGLCAAGSALASTANAQAVSTPTPPTQETVTVTARPAPTGLAKLPETVQKTPQTIDVISSAQMKQQAATSLQDALRYAPGVTLNSGEGGAHGDNVNLRGFSAIDGFFLDGIRDPGSYTRDNFDTEGVSVIQGPASLLFGNGPAGGAVNQASKQPTLAPLRTLTVETGTNDEARGTLDVNEPVGPNAAVRLNLMGETTNVADRDYVRQRRWGAAPSLSLGLNTPTSFTLSYFHQEENNVPDYGIPFLFGAPAPVNRSLYYGLKNVDVSQTQVDIVTATLRHEFNDNIALSNSFRYGSYWSNYRVTAPIYASDFAGGAPAPGTPLADILVYRDRPSSEGLQTYLTDHTDLTARFDTGWLSHLLVAGFEAGRQTSGFARFDNEFEGVDGIAPTRLLAPDANETAPAQNTVVAHPNSEAGQVGVYLTDRIGFAPHLSLDLGVRFDRYDTTFSDSVSGETAHRVDNGWTPKASLVFTPTDTQTYYVSYTTSFDPAVSYLTLAPATNVPPPQTAETYEIGGKFRWLQGMLQSTAALFRIDSANITISDPDDPTLQQMPGSHQRVQGIELTTSGYLTDNVELYANYTYLDPVITASSTPQELGRTIPEVARNNANLWIDYEPSDRWQFGAGANFVDQRYADTLNKVRVPGYVLFNAMAGYQLAPGVRLQVNIQNIADVKYFAAAYYTDEDENHAVPGQGRVITFNTRIGF